MIYLAEFKKMELTYTLTELSQVAEKVLANAKNRTLLFHGAMGAGKTTMIKELAKQLGVTDTITSPTFSLVNEYKLSEKKLYHFDFYRIDSEDEALDIGVEEYFDSNDWIFVEWPEKIPSLLPVENTKLQLTINQNGSRTLNMEPVK
jgi:tRNA threonylcarbamoyladenosine biosynthesis protein TsaE